VKINVIGSSGSGKSTLASALAKRLGVEYIEMDRLFWLADWQMPSDEQFKALLVAAMAQPGWVLDGNYSRTTELKWREVDMVVWVDYSFSRTLYQSLSRALKRIFSQQELWPGTGNRETWGRLLSKDSILLWMLKNYRHNRRRYLAIMQSPRYSHIRFVQLRSPAQAQQFLASIGNAQAIVKRPS